MKKSSTFTLKELKEIASAKDTSMYRVDLRTFKPSILYLISLAIVMGIGDMNLGIVLDSTNSVERFFRVSLFDNDEETTQLWASMISAIGVLGTAFGSIFGGTIIRHGRRRILIIAGWIAIIGSGLSLIPNKYCILFGQLIFGIGGGISMSAASTILEETCPAHLFDKGFGQSTIVSIAFIIFIIQLVTLYVLPTQLRITDLREAKYNADLEGK